MVYGRKSWGGGVKISKAINLALTSWGYGLAILALFILWGYSIPKSIVVKSLIGPIYPSFYWFVSTFIVFYLLMPILSLAVNNMTSKSLFYIAIIGGIFVPCYNFIFENVGGTLAYFCYTFFLIGLLKRNDDNFIKKHRYCIFICSSLIIVVLVVLGSFISGFWGGQKLLNLLVRVHDSRNIFTIVQAVSLFYIFKELKPFSSMLVNEVAKTAFGTYLITENIVIRGDSNSLSILWNEWFHFANMYEGNSFVLYSTSVIMLIFVCAIGIDYLRLVIAQKMNLHIRLIDKLDRWSLDCFPPIQKETSGSLR